MDGNLSELENRVKDDPEVFAELYELNYARIFNYVLYNTAEIEVSLDITSETFFKALRALPRFDRQKGSFTSWLYSIASREITSYFRRLNRSKKYNASQSKFMKYRKEIWENTSLEEIEETRKELERSDDFNMLAPLIRKLPMKYREVLFLRYYEDKSIEEIANILGRPVGSVKAQCHRGLNLLRKWMQPLAETERVEEYREERAPDDRD